MSDEAAERLGSAVFSDLMLQRVQSRISIQRKNDGSRYHPGPRRGRGWVVAPISTPQRPVLLQLTSKSFPFATCICAIPTLLSDLPDDDSLESTRMLF